MEGLFAISFIVLCSNVFADPTAPALIWSPERSMSSLPEIRGVEAVNQESFLKEYLEPLMAKSSESAVIFLQNKLHTDDFTKFADVYSLDSNGGAFKNIKSLMEDHFSLELPAVLDPIAAVKSLKSNFAHSVHTVSDAAQAEALDLLPSNRFLLVVDLAAPKAGVGQEEAIAQNDATVGAICKHLEKRGVKYTALFTGKPAEETETETLVGDSHSGRHLLSVDAGANTTHFSNHSGIFLYVRDITVKIVNKGVPQVLNLTVTPESSSTSTNENGTAVIRWDLNTGSGQNGTGDQNVKIAIETLHQKDRWVIQRVSMSISGSGQEANGTLTNVTLMMGDVERVIPIDYSFHCSSLHLGLNRTNKALADFRGTEVIIGGLQMQPFNVQHDAFFNAQDCVGFFTTGIWMGIVPSLILLGILLFGTMMVLSLSTPDKFDDPKGKTIHVAQAED